MNKIATAIYMILAGVILILGCDEITDPADTETTLSITSLEVQAHTLLAGDSTSAWVRVEYDGEEALSYWWNADAGTFLTSTDQDSVVWQAPDSAREVVLGVVVSDGIFEDTAFVSIDIYVLNTSLIPLALIEGKQDDCPGREIPILGDVPKFLMNNSECPRLLELQLVMPDSAGENVQVHWSTDPSTSMEAWNYWMSTGMQWWPPNEPGMLTFNWEITDGIDTVESSMQVEIVGYDEFDTFAHRAPRGIVYRASHWGDISRFVSKTIADLPSDLFTIRLLNSAGGIEKSNTASTSYGEEPPPPEYFKLNTSYCFTRKFTHYSELYYCHVKLYSDYNTVANGRALSSQHLISVTMNSDTETEFFLSYGMQNWGFDVTESYRNHFYVESVDISLNTIWKFLLPDLDNLEWPMWVQRLPSGKILIECAKKNGDLYYCWLESDGEFADSTSYAGRASLIRSTVLSDGTIVGIADGSLVAISGESLATLWTYGSNLSLYRLLPSEEIVICTPSSGKGVDITILSSSGSVVRTLTILEDFDTFASIGGFDVTDDGYFIIGANSATQEGVGWMIRANPEGYIDPDNFLYSNW